MSNQLFVGNLPFSVGWQELKDLFKDAGAVVRADVALNGGRSKGFGTVSFQSEEDASKAIEMFNDFEFYGRRLEVRHDLAAGKNKFERKTVDSEKGERYSRSKDNDQSQKSGIILFVGNLPYSTQWQDLKDMFREAGNVIRADIGRDANWRHKGYGQVVMSSEEEALKAIELFDGHEIDGRKIEVREDKFGSVESSSGENGVQIFVGNLPFSFRWQDLKDIIRNEGFTASHVEVLMDSSGRSKGCGVARFQSRELADDAIKALDGLEVSGRNISVRMDKYSV